jgi:hypothetical protein
MSINERVMHETRAISPAKKSGLNKLLDGCRVKTIIENIMIQTAGNLAARFIKNTSGTIRTM